ncbi:hypothetical protein EVAR_78807_1 [Eumeta japonica]|uniref:Uncharacterized protein n=1 Tax=Eumeta variegata TaxID=151549 RepID=A0A4C1T4F1_EUMVA|nr:hypothetical protein EVAR_78807_1 [Eumeta japonica]
MYFSKEPFNELIEKTLYNGNGILFRIWVVAYLKLSLRRRVVRRIGRLEEVTFSYGYERVFLATTPKRRAARWTKRGILVAIPALFKNRITRPRGGTS